MRNLLLLSAVISLGGRGYSLRWSRIGLCPSGEQRIFVSTCDIWVHVKLVKEILLLMLDGSSKAKRKVHMWSNVPPHPSLLAILYLGAVVRMKQIRCFVPVISPNYFKHYTFDFIAFLKSECWCFYANSSSSGFLEIFSVPAALNLGILPKMHKWFGKKILLTAVMYSYRVGVFPLFCLVSYISSLFPVYMNCMLSASLYRTFTFPWRAHSKLSVVCISVKLV